MDDLETFLRARLAEDEQAAAHEPSGRRIHPEDLKWTYQPDGDPDVPGGEVIARGHRIIVDQSEVVAAHIARHDPARVLREVEAKRLILAEHQLATETVTATGDFSGEIGCTVCSRGDSGEVVATGHCRTLRLLALPYADHPDYRQEWKP